jgi:hypothetical protein
MQYDWLLHRFDLLHRLRLVVVFVCLDFFWSERELFGQLAVAQVVDAVELLGH